MKKIIVLAGILSACSGGGILSAQKYIDAMAALGCKNLQEGNPAADEVLKQTGVTPEQIQKFRQKTDFKVIADAAAEITKRVYACHGVNQ